MFANRKFRFAALAVIIYALVFVVIDRLVPGMILAGGSITAGVWLMTFALFLWAMHQQIGGNSDPDPPAAS